MPVLLLMLGTQHTICWLTPRHLIEEIRYTGQNVPKIVPMSKRSKSKQSRVKMSQSQNVPKSKHPRVKTSQVIHTLSPLSLSCDAVTAVVVWTTCNETWDERWMKFAYFSPLHILYRILHSMDIPSWLTTLLHCMSNIVYSQTNNLNICYQNGMFSRFRMLWLGTFWLRTFWLWNILTGTFWLGTFWLWDIWPGSSQKMFPVSSLIKYAENILGTFW